MISQAFEKYDRVTAKYAETGTMFGNVDERRKGRKENGMSRMGSMTVCCLLKLHLDQC